MRLLESRRARRLFKSASIISAVLCVAAAAVWVRSYFALDNFVYHSIRDDGDLAYWRQSIMTSGRGRIRFTSFVQSGPRGEFRAAIDRIYARRPVQFHRSMKPVSVDRSRWGIQFATFESGWNGKRPQFSSIELVAPIWSFLVTFLMLPVVWLKLWRAGKIEWPKGHCPTCGYNLTGNTSGICPECGSTRKILLAADR